MTTTGESGLGGTFAGNGVSITTSKDATGKTKTTLTISLDAKTLSAQSKTTFTKDSAKTAIDGQIGAIVGGLVCSPSAPMGLIEAVA